MVETIRPLDDEETFRKKIAQKFVTEATKMMNSTKSKKKLKRKTRRR